MLALGCYFSQNASAQLVLQRADFGYVGGRFAMDVDTFYSVQTNFADSGTAKIWDFTGLTGSGAYVSKIVDPATTPDGSTYPDADLALQEDSAYDSYLYVKTEASKITVVGQSDADPDGPAFNFRLMVFPAAYGDSWADSSETQVVMPAADAGIPGFDSVRLTIKLVFRSELDAEGSLRLPTATKDALRLKRIVSYDVAIEGKSNMLPTWIPVGNQGQEQPPMYEFYGQAGGNLLARVTEREDGDFSVEYRTESLVGMKDVVAAQLPSVYPNPADKFINISNINYPSAYRMMSITGTQVMEGTITGDSDRFDVSNLQKGVYFLSVDGNNGSVQTVKVVVK